MIYYLFIKVKIQVFYRQNSGNLLYFYIGHRALFLKNINTVFRWSRQSSPLKSIARILFFFYRIHLFLNGLVLIQPWHNVHIFNETIINGLHFKNISRRKNESLISFLPLVDFCFYWTIAARRMWILSYSTKKSIFDGKCSYKVFISSTLGSCLWWALFSSSYNNSQIIVNIMLCSFI